jgi:NitT/TauT family transport system substrate-binding protein
VKLAKIIFLAAVLILFGTSPRATKAQALTPVRIIFDPTFYTHLPIEVAIDKGYFKDEGIDLQLTPASGSSTLFLPMMARGDYDLGTVNPSPAFFNQYSAGFNVVVLATMAASKAGWHDASWLVVRQDLWDSKAIQKPADLRGRNVDSSNLGSPIDFLMKQTIAYGGLKRTDVTLTERFRSIDNWVEALRNKATDVIGGTEPQVTEIANMGLGHVWISFSTVAPWYQLEYIGASAKFAQEHPDLIRKFMRAYVRGNDDVLRSNGKWTPYLLDEAVKWSKLPVEVLRSLGGPIYPSDHGTVSLESLTRIQQFWLDEKQINATIDPNKVVYDAQMLRDVQRSLHR